MQWSARRAHVRANPCVVALFAAVVAGPFGPVAAGPALAGDLTPAEVVATRFPPGLNFGPASRPAVAPVWPAPPAVSSAPRSAPAPASTSPALASATTRPAAP